MARLFVLTVLLAALVGCTNTGVSSSEAEAQSKEWNQDAYEEAMIKAGREDELKAEKEKWAESNAQSGRGESTQPEGQGGGLGG